MTRELSSGGVYHKRKYIDLLEGVQRRATRLVPELRRLIYDKRIKQWRRLSYEERLTELSLPRLEDRRIRGDMIETYKIITGKEDVKAEKLFKMAKVRGARNNTHCRKIESKSKKLGVRRNFFSQRVIKKWNSLTKDEVTAKKTSDFKARYDQRELGRKQSLENDIYVWG